MIQSLPEWLKFTMLEIAYLASNFMVAINPFIYIGFSSELRKKMVKFYFRDTSESTEGPNAAKAKGTPFTWRSAKRGAEIHPAPAGGGSIGRTAREVKERRKIREHDHGEVIELG